MGLFVSLKVIKCCKSANKDIFKSLKKEVLIIPQSDIKNFHLVSLYNPTHYKRLIQLINHV